MIQTGEEITERRTCSIAAPSPLKSYMDCLGIKFCPSKGTGRHLIFSEPTPEERIPTFFLR
jgi:hypothetical protein